jgi:hypothetical protein
MLSSKSYQIYQCSSHYFGETTVKNEGKAITTWYLIKFEIAKEVYLGEVPRINRLVGDIISSPTSDTHWHINNLPEKQIWSFMSNGMYALYPNYHQPFSEIDFNFSIEEKYPDSCTIPFVIYTDKGKEEKGELKLNYYRLKAVGLASD